MFLRLKGNSLKHWGDEYTWTDVTPEPENVDFLTLYKYVPTINRGIEMRANNIASMPYSWYKGDKELDKAPDKFQYFDSELPIILRHIEQSLCIFGHSYLLPIKNEYGFNLTLDPLSTNNITIVHNGNGEINHFLFSFYTTNERLYPDECVWVWLNNPIYSNYPGYSPLINAYTTGFAIYNLDAFTQKFFKNGAIKATILKIGSDNPLSPTPTREEVGRLQRLWENLVTGTRNAFKNLVFANDVTPVTIGEGLQDLDYSQILDKKREDVAVALGVPQSLLYDNSASFATAQQAYLTFYTITILPETNLIFRRINQQFLQQYGYEIKAKPEQLEVFQKSELEKAQSLMFIGLDLTQNERRELFGFEPVEETSQAEQQQLESQQMQQSNDAYAKATNPLILRCISAIDDFVTEQDELEADFNVAFDTIIERVDKPRDGGGRFVSSGSVERRYMISGLVQTQRARLSALQSYYSSSETEYNAMLELFMANQELERKQLRKDLKFHRDEYLEKANEWAKSKVQKKSLKALTDLEANMYTRLLKLLEPYLDKATAAIINASDFDFEALSDDLQEVLLPLLEDVFIEYSNLIISDTGVEIPIEDLQTLSSQWAEDYTYDLIKDLDNTSRDVVADAISSYLDTEGMTRQDVEDKLQQAFGKVRADKIAVTETTRAAAASATLLKDHYKEYYDLDYTKKWNTNADDLVCPICGPNNGKLEEEVEEEIPAHVGCRCTWTLVLVE